MSSPIPCGMDKNDYSGMSNKSGIGYCNVGNKLYLSVGTDLPVQVCTRDYYARHRSQCKLSFSRRTTNREVPEKSFLDY